MLNIREFIDVDKVIAWRRHLHMWPEVSFHEVETAKYLVGEVGRYAGVEVLRPSGNALVAVLKGGKAGGTVALRADFDALPVGEESGLPFASKNAGISHVCGHDCHTAMLLGALDALYKVKDELCGTVLFVFQDAEELMPGGAAPIVKSGVLDKAEAFFALHVFPDDAAGVVKVVPGAASANADRFAIKVIGKGTHAAMPESGVDSLLIGAQIVQALNFIVSRNVASTERAVLTVGAFNAGTTFNVIPHTAELKGTVRTFNGDVRDLVESRVAAVVRGICDAHGATYELDYERGYACIVNDEGLCHRLAKIIGEHFPDVKLDAMIPMMGAEDFSAYGDIAPTLFATLCAKPDTAESYMNHHPKFQIDEKALPIGAGLYAAFALDFCK